MSDLRKIIVTATSEMLDDPGEHGIYKTTRFYDRLEREITEYMVSNSTAIDIQALIADVVKNSVHLSIPLQNVIAKYIDYQSAPIVTVSNQALADSLFGKDDAKV